ncbi:MAG: carbonic anhydrase [Bryobacteraceae bacterium]
MKNSVIKKLAAGWQQYQSEHHSRHEGRYASLAEKQDPKVLFITCADSRIEPAVMFQSEPGDLFVARNPGNIVPPYGAVLGGASASLEYALTVLSVSDIIVCGHSNCGAMKGLLYPQGLKQMPLVSNWLKFASAAHMMHQPFRRSTPLAQRIACLAQENAVVQLDHLKTYPAVASKLARLQVRLHAWHYDIRTGGITCFDPESGAFRPLATDTPPAYSRRSQVGRTERR